MVRVLDCSKNGEHVPVGLEHLHAPAAPLAHDHQLPVLGVIVERDAARAVQLTRFGPEAQPQRRRKRAAVQCLYAVVLVVGDPYPPVDGAHRDPDRLVELCVPRACRPDARLVRQLAVEDADAVVVPVDHQHAALLVDRNAFGTRKLHAFEPARHVSRCFAVHHQHSVLLVAGQEAAAVGQLCEESVADRIATGWPTSKQTR